VCVVCVFWWGGGRGREGGTQVGLDDCMCRLREGREEGREEMREVWREERGAAHLERVAWNEKACMFI